MTDRPVYRPAQRVHYKVWVRHARYDEPDSSDFAGREFVVQIYDPRGQKVVEQKLTADAYGGIEGEYPLSKGAMLGVYSLTVLNYGGGQFRVEEYKKPEFEVQVEAPKKPVRLGETIQATIKAKYYFGAPVTRAKVKYKVLRTNHDGTWYPPGVWDWLYGPGYWWFAADYAWYPGWGRWGCVRPVPAWWGRGHEQPEVVAENEVPVNPDGTVSVTIDTRPAQESIPTRTTSTRSRPRSRTNPAARSPAAARCWWLANRSRSSPGSTAATTRPATSSMPASGQTLDRQPVQGHGELTLFQVHYNAKQKPVEKAVQTWQLDTNAQGEAQEQIKAAEPGQYRLSYRVTDSQRHTIEGGYLFVVRGEGFDGHQFRFNDIELTTDRREYAPGDNVKVLLNTNHANATVLLFLRPTNGVYLAPKLIRMHGKSVEETVAVVKKDMPNFFVEALTVAGAKVYSEVREVVVPPEKRVLKLAVQPSQQEYLPGQKATVKLKLTDLFGKPFVGTARTDDLRQERGIHLRRLQYRRHPHGVLELAAEPLSTDRIQPEPAVVQSGSLRRDRGWRTSARSGRR